ncbi:MAG TPA: hypothetical protein VLA32_09685 [Anaerolineales bacterium]|nr:hypothetical protein [Anaerolineales bacterium]
MNDRRNLWIGVILGGLILVGFCCFVVISGGFIVLRELMPEVDAFSENFSEILSTPTPTAQALSTWQVSEEGVDLVLQNLHTLEGALVPENDPADLAVRLGGVDSVPETYPDPNAPYEIGDRKEFWVIDTNSNITSKRLAILRAVTDHVYFWIEDGVSYRQNDLDTLVFEFEEQIYPTTREFFGSEWNPGIDGDPHIFILYVSGIGVRTAGYFSSADSLHPLAHEYSNAHELFVFNADNSPLDEPYTYGVLAHEFQHMIHWYWDRNEYSWVNEGFSELSTLLNGYDPGGFDYYFASNPDIQLTDWPNHSGSTTPHYGASFLFMTYFMDRMGRQVSQQFMAHPENGLASIDLLFEEISAKDPRTGTPITADDLVLDWALTNYILDEDVWDGRYYYPSYPEAPQVFETESFYGCQPGNQPRTVSQYGTDYIRLVCSGSHTLRFEGALKTALLPQTAHSGDFSFWSNKGDESDMTLTREFDFTGVSGPLTFSYWTWYDIETDYDYVYLLASTDGTTWEILQTPSGTDQDPSGNSYGWGYNDVSGGDGSWIEEQVDLSTYAGQRVWLRFEYITDAAVNGEGLLLDDLSIPEIGYFSDLEEDAGGWEPEGFVRVSNILPQTFRLALVIREKDQTRVEYLSLPDDNVLEIPFEIGGDVREVTLVVLGTTRFTRQLASYQIDFLP